MPLILPNTIERDTTADAVEVEQNNGVLTQYVNTNLISRDGSVAMTNPLLLAGDPTQPNQASNKGYVDGRDALYLPLAGGTVTGPIKGVAPVAAEDLTRKDYVDTTTVSVTGDTMTGALTADRVLVSATQDFSANALTRKDYVDSHVVGPVVATATGTAVSGFTVPPASAVGVAALSIPAKTRAGYLMCYGNCNIAQTVPTDTFDLMFRIDGDNHQISRTVGYSGAHTVSYVHYLPASTGALLQLAAARASGTGTGTTVNDSRYHYLYAIWFPV